MAQIRWYLNNTTLDGWQLLDQSAATAATLVNGWVVGTGSTNSSEFASGAAGDRASTTFTANTVPDGTLDTTLKDAMRSQFAWTGDFAAGNWTFQFAVVSTVQAGAADGQIVFRILKADANGANATQITTGQVATTIATNVAATDVNISATWAAPAWSITNQYIFVQVAWKRTGAGGMTTTNIRLRTGSTTTVGTTGLTANFTPGNQAVTTQFIAATAGTPTTVTIGEKTGASFPGCQETILRQSSPTQSDYFAMATFDAAKYDVGDHTHAIIKFPGLSNLPVAATVSAASVNLVLDLPTTGVAHTITLRRVLRNWVQNQVSWNNYSTGNAWTTPGATSADVDRAAAVSAASSVVSGAGTSTAFTDVQLIADVQGFVNGTLSNYGWHLERTDGQDDETYRSWHASEAPNATLRPSLSVTYAVGGPFAPTVSAGAAVTAVTGVTIASTATQLAPTVAYAIAGPHSRSSARIPSTETLWFEPPVGAGLGSAGLGFPGLGWSQTISGHTGFLTSVSLEMGRLGNPPDAVYVEIREGTQTGSLRAASVSVVAATLAVSPAKAWVNFPLHATCALSAGTTYWINVLLTRQVETDDTCILHTSDGGYTGGSLYDHFGNAYVASDVKFRLYTGSSHTVAAVQSVATATRPSTVGLFAPTLKAAHTLLILPILAYEAMPTWDATGLGLLTGLVGYWPMDETGMPPDTQTNALDRQSTNDLTDRGFVQALGHGRQGGAARAITASGSRYFASTSSLFQNGNIDFSFSLWFYPHAVGIHMLVTKDNIVQREYQMNINSGINFYWFDAAGTSHAVITYTGTIYGYTWQHLAFGHDAANDQIWISVNGSARITGATGGISPTPSATEFRIGTWAYAGTPYFFEGGIDELAFWKRKLTDAELTWLYNAGTGRNYGAMLPVASRVLVSVRNTYYPLLAYPDTGYQEACWTGVMPRHYGGGPLEVTLMWTAVATSGTVGWQAYTERLSAEGPSLDSLLANWSSAGSGNDSPSVVSGQVQYTTFTVPSTVAAGELFRLDIARDGSVASNMVGNAELLGLELREG